LILEEEKEEESSKSFLMKLMIFIGSLKVLHVYKSMATFLSSTNV
jgi:hypothetical protein